MSSASPFKDFSFEVFGIGNKVTKFDMLCSNGYIIYVKFKLQRSGATFLEGEGVFNLMKRVIGTALKDKWYDEEL